MTESMIVNEWIRQGEVRGQLSGARRILLRLLERKFAGLMPQELARAISEQGSLEVLDLWFDDALTANTMEEFIAASRR